MQHSGARWFDIYIPKFNALLCVDAIALCLVCCVVFCVFFIIENWTDHANSSTELPFIMCLFRYHKNEKLYQFLSLSFDLLRAFPTGIRSPNPFAICTIFSFSSHTHTHTIRNIFRLLLWFVRRIDIETESHFFVQRYIAIKLNKYFRKRKKQEK